ncbi:MAG TPA: hypothetical protein VJ966_19735, partial [Actinomycetes bacterium]|nr:hypothetical protein [Actinomycetes bacterium]
RLLNAYIARLHAAAAHDVSLASAFVRVAGLVAPPQTLLRPDVAVRVLWGRRASSDRHRRLQHRDAVRVAQTLADKGDVSP